MEIVSLLKKLSDACGVSGYEDAARDVASEAFTPYCDELRTDALGNLIGLKRGSRADGVQARSIMLTGHLDEIGLIVTALEGQFIRFHSVGGFDVRTLPGQQVTVHASSDLTGVIGYRAPHVSPRGGKPTPIDKLYIDVGLPEDQLKEQVRVGDTATIRSTCTELTKDKLCGKAFDDRAAVGAIALCLQLLSKRHHEWDVYAVASVQEEVGLRGAFTSTYGIMPDVGIAIDVGFAKQPGIPEHQRVEMGKGPALCAGPHLHPAFNKAIRDLAGAEEIPIQSEFTSGSTGTEADAIQITREGIPAALLSIPSTNMHTPVESVSVKDVQRTARLLAAFIMSLDGEFMDTLVLDKQEDGDAK
jgi:endoglucanase